MANLGPEGFDAREFTASADAAIARATFDNAVDAIRSTTTGRKLAINAKAFLVGKLVGAGRVDRSDAFKRLCDAGTHTGHRRSDVEQWVRKALADGARQPLVFDPQARGETSDALQRKPTKATPEPVRGHTEDEKARIAHAWSNWERSTPLPGSYAAKYLVNRTGIPLEGIEALRETGQVRATGRFLWTAKTSFTEALIVAATTPAGDVQAVQAVAVTRQGAKKYPKGGKPNKMTNGVLAGAAVRLPGEGDPILIEGPEKGIAVWWATRRPVLIALGDISRIAAEIPDGAAVTVCEDYAPKAPKKAHEKFIETVVAPLMARGCRVTVAMPEQPDKSVKTDFDDIALKNGFDAVAQAIADAPIFQTDTKPNLPPHFPRPRLTGEKAGRNLRRVMRRWLDVVERHFTAQDRRDQLVDVLIAGFPPERRQKFFERVRATDDKLTGFDEINAEVDRRITARCRAAATTQAKRLFGIKGRLDRLPAIQIKGSAGLGKTTAFIDEFLSRPSLWGRHIAFYVPTLKLAEELRVKVQKAIDEAQLVGPRVFAIEGRNKDNCARFHVVDAGAKKVQSQYKAFCKLDDHECPYYSECIKSKYLKQHQYKGPALRIFAHEHIALQQTADLRLPDAEIAIVDENCLHALINKVIISPCEFSEPETYEKGSAEDIERCVKIGRSIQEAFESETTELINDIDRRGVTSDDLRFAAEIAAEGAEQPGIIPSMHDIVILKRFELFKANNGIRVAAIMRQLARDIDFGRWQSIAVEYNKRYIISGKYEDYEVQKVVLHKMHGVTIPVKAGLCLIDADAIFDANDIAFKRTLKRFTIQAERKAFTTQCISTSLSKGYLLADIKYSKGRKQVKRAIAMRMEIECYIRSFTADGSKVLVVTNRPVRKAFTGETSDKLPLFAEWNGVNITHFGAFLGQDIWKDYGVVIVIGREQISQQDAEDSARAIYGNSVNELKLGGGYLDETRFFDMRDGSQKSVTVKVHTDARVQQFVELIREGGIGQGIDRLRMIHGQEKRVVVLSDIPVPGLTVDVAANYEDIVSGKAAKMPVSHNINHLASARSFSPKLIDLISVGVKTPGSAEAIDNKGNMAENAVDQSAAKVGAVAVMTLAPEPDDQGEAVKAFTGTVNGLVVGGVNATGNVITLPPRQMPEWMAKRVGNPAPVVELMRAPIPDGWVDVLGEWSVEDVPAVSYPRGTGGCSDMTPEDERFLSFRDWLAVMIGTG